jgi:hypothetical protein
MALEKESKTFEREKANLLSQQGKFALVSGDAVEGAFDTYEDALRIGYEKFGLKPFLVRKIQAVEEVQYFSRDLAFECHTGPFLFHSVAR